MKRDSLTLKIRRKKPSRNSQTKILSGNYLWMGHQTRQEAEQGQFSKDHIVLQPHSALRLSFPASNNVAEYESLINDLQSAAKVGVTDLQVYNDSHLVVNHIKGVYQAKDETTQKYLARVKRIEREFSNLGIQIQYCQIPQAENEEADQLSRLSIEGLG